MPTHDEWALFLREFRKLTESEQDAFIYFSGHEPVLYPAANA